MLVLGVSCSALMVALTVYWLSNEPEKEPVWEMNIRQKCPDYFTMEDHTIERFYSGRIMASFGLIGYLAGAYCGTVL